MAKTVNSDEPRMAQLSIRARAQDPFMATSQHIVETMAEAANEPAEDKQRGKVACG